MTLNLNSSTKNAAVAAAVGYIDGAGQGKIMLFSGVQPSSGDVPADFSTLLCQILLPTTSFQTPVSGVATANGTPLNGAISASGTAAWFRVFRGNGSPVCDGSITVTGGGGDMTMDTISLIQGGVVSIQSFTIGSP